MQAVQHNSSKLKDNSQSMRFMRLFFDALTFLPYLWVFSFTLFVIATRLEVGQMPSYGNPDPKDTLLAWFFLPLVYGSLIASFASISVWTILAILAASKRLPLSLNFQRVLLYLLPILIFFFLRFQTNLFEWLID